MSSGVVVNIVVGCGFLFAALLAGDSVGAGTTGRLQPGGALHACQAAVVWCANGAWKAQTESGSLCCMSEATKLVHREQEFLLMAVT